MNSQFALFDLLILIGITHGTITGVLLLCSKKNEKSNKFLGLGLLAFSFLSTKPLLHSLNLWDMPFFRFFPNGTEVLIAPLIYFYIVSLIRPNFKFKRKDLIHFMPFFISQLYAFIVYFSALSIPDSEAKDAIAIALYFDEVKKTEDYLSLISIVSYLLFGAKELFNYRNWLKNNISDNTYPNFNWLKNIYIVGCIFGFILFLNLGLDFFFDLKSWFYLHWQGFAILMSALIYYLGLVGYQQPDFEMITERPVVEELPSPNLEEGKLKEIALTLENTMTKEKLYLNPVLSIQELSKHLGIPQRMLSKSINQYFKKNFRDYINEYRVNEVIRKLDQKDLQYLSIIGIALDCGFNSEASFYRIFKKHTGKSPKEFLLKEA